MKKLAPETSKSHYAREYSGFYQKYMQGKGIDVGYRGSEDDTHPLNQSTGIDLDTPNYDGIYLPYPDNTLDYVFSSHMLEHVEAPTIYIKEWHRVTKENGYIIIIVPHQYLYEKKAEKPSKWNAGHHTFYTPSILLQQIEFALKPNSYRIRHLRDNDTHFDYEKGPEVHSSGGYEIELVLQRIKQPTWEIE